ncbi:MAG: bacillithiol system redox-active protein YtxJ [Acidobacteria bacterium]|nr:bacillithiol system redox-active protein YtxJ [Acidobacteriota bacterium]
MHPNLIQLNEVAQVDQLISASDPRPLVIFKHSRSCGTSAQAFDELLDHLDASEADARYAIVTVQTHRDVSTAVSRLLGVRHETPQALIVQDGKVVWSASHFRVTAEAVNAAIKRLQSSEGGSSGPEKSVRL